MAKTVIHSTAHYNLVLMDGALRELYPECNYAVMHKEWDVVEAACPALYVGYEALEALEEKLVEALPKEPSPITLVH